MSQDEHKAPFPWFGGKRKAADLVWRLIGDVPHYVEPFAGSLAVLLERPHTCNRAYHSETVNDLDGFIVNAWRAIQWYPEEVARAASWPVTEFDKQARQIACNKWRTEKTMELLAGTADWCDPVIAGWWLYGIACQIGGIKGPWTADPKTGRIRKIKDIMADPEYADMQDGEEGVSRKLPHLGDDGRGVAAPQMREEGVARDRPELIDNGQGVAHAGCREEGVSRKRPHLGNNGCGVAAPQMREEGVSRDRPHIGNNGQGVAHAGCREEGVSPRTRFMSDVLPNEFHPHTMPKLIRWMQLLCARLRHVRIVNGDWKRVCTGGAAWTLPVRQGKGPCGMFIDPPYDTEIRSADLYLQDAHGLSAEVRKWCVENGESDKFRIVLAGFEGEHNELEALGWTKYEWYKKGHLTGGMGNIDGTSKQHMERLWASPHCLNTNPTKQVTRGLFEDVL